MPSVCRAEQWNVAKVSKNCESKFECFSQRTFVVVLDFYEELSLLCYEYQDSTFSFHQIKIPFLYMIVLKLLKFQYFTDGKIDYLLFGNRLR